MSLQLNPYVQWWFNQDFPIHLTRQLPPNIIRILLNEYSTNAQRFEAFVTLVQNGMAPNLAKDAIDYWTYHSETMPLARRNKIQRQTTQMVLEVERSYGNDNVARIMRQRYFGYPRFDYQLTSNNRWRNF